MDLVVNPVRDGGPHSGGAGTGLPPSKPPLCVDLDGSLIRTDLLHESLLRLAAERTQLLALVPVWTARGKAALKAELAQRVEIDAASLPYNEDVLSYLRAEREAGRRLVLATASHVSLAKSIADHLGLFDAVVATANGRNRGGAEKARQLVEMFGEKGFAYLGDSPKDVPVWRVASGALVVGDGMADRVTKLGLGVERRFSTGGPGLVQLLRSMRPHQWLKNLLVFVVLLASHQVGNIQLLFQAALAFVCFGLCASSVYILNDLLDLPSDRVHARKRKRPFASGALSIPVGVALAPGLLAASIILAALLLPMQFLLVLAIYFAITLAYSLRLKRVVMVDVIVLAGLYTMRIIAGGAAVGLAPSFWLLAFSMFLFLALALAKRYAELLDMAANGRVGAAGRGYRTTDQETLVSLGASAGYCSVLVLALYINGDVARASYRAPELLWLVCPLLLYWISRVWMAARRGKLTDDPVIFAMKDSVSRLTFALAGLAVIGATLVELPVRFG